jgi:cysteinyl-tRNA synthetase
LVFPHHESEIAQTESLTGKPFAGHWLHVAPVRHLGEKISKSLGNLVMVRDLLDRWSPDAIRVYLASHHYRDSWDYDAEALYDAARDAQGLAAAAALASAEGEPLLVDEFVSEFARALEQDLNTPAAIAALRRLADSIVAASNQGGALGAAQDVLRKLGDVLGLRLGSAGPEGKVVEGWRRHLIRFRSEPFPG